MKKLLPIILAFTMLMSLCLNGCDTTPPERGTESESAAESVTENETLEKETDGKDKTDGTDSKVNTETSTEIGAETSTETSTEIGAETGTETGTETDTEMGTETGTETDTEMGTETDTETGTDTATVTDGESESISIGETESKTVKETESETEKVTGKETVKETESETEKVTEKETVKETESETEKVTEKETVKETESETEKVTEKETVKETESETETEADKCGGEHSDTDNNGLCDECNISVVILLDFFAINDLHGKFCDSSSQVGVDEMTTYFKDAYDDGYVIVLSSGDMWQGGSESNFTKGNIVTDWMNHIGVVSMTLGNHEYDWGEEFIENNAAIAEFPFLAINVYDSDTGERAEYCQPSVMVERGGATIGIIGAIGDCHSSISGEVSSGFYFKTGSELTDLVKAEAQRLRAAGADYIVYSIHDGYGSSSASVGSISDSDLRYYYDPTLSEGYVDIVFEGHSHQYYVLVDGEGVYHLQGGGDNNGISHAEVTINFANGKNSLQVAEYLPSSAYADLEDDPIVDTLLEKYKDEIAVGSVVLGYNDTYRDGSALCQLIADLYIKAGLEAFGDEYDIVLGGGYISVRSPYYMDEGEITYAQLQSLFTFDNELVLCSIKGYNLLNKFINTTNKNYYIAFSEYGDSIKNSINSNETYYVIVDTYSSTYASNGLTEIARYKPGVFARDLLADYIKKGGLGWGTEVEFTSIPDVLALGAAIPDNHQTTAYHYVKGTVTSVVSTKYGNIYIEDEDGNELYVYGVWDYTGKVRYDGMTDPPAVGDEVVLYAPVARYVSQAGAVTIELKNAWVLPLS